MDTTLSMKMKQFLLAANMCDKTAFPNPKYGNCPKLLQLIAIDNRAGTGKRVTNEMIELVVQEAMEDKLRSIEFKDLIPKLQVNSWVKDPNSSIDLQVKPDFLIKLYNGIRGRGNNKEVTVEGRVTGNVYTWKLSDWEPDKFNDEGFNLDESELDDSLKLALHMIRHPPKPQALNVDDADTEQKRKKENQDNYIKSINANSLTYDGINFKRGNDKIKDF